MKKIILFISLIYSFSVYSQHIQLSEKAEISLITAGPGNTELYEAFGHTTVRVFDPLQGIDDAYNYGIFDFDAPNFYLNFVKGNMLYKLAKYPFSRFIYSYKRDNRWINEQILNLTIEEKQQFFAYLENNAKPENATYSYDPYFNNCSTIVKDITKTILKDKLTFNKQPESTTLRSIMNIENPQNTWGSFGINVALGNILDRKATFEETLYLPDHLSEAFRNATITRNNIENPLIKQERKILDYKELEQKVAAFFNPIVIFSLISIFILFITYKDYKKNRRSKWLDFILFFTTGLIGLLIVFLWFFTSHSTAPNNFNFLWAFAPNLFVSFYLLKSKLPTWIKKYHLFSLFLLLLLVLFWIFKIQQFSISIIPILIFLSVRYYYLFRNV